MVAGASWATVDERSPPPPEAPTGPPSSRGSGHLGAAPRGAPSKERRRGGRPQLRNWERARVADVGARTGGGRVFCFRPPKIRHHDRSRRPGRRRVARGGGCRAWPPDEAGRWGNRRRAEGALAEAACESTHGGAAPPRSAKRADGFTGRRATRHRPRGCGRHGVFSDELRAHARRTTNA